MRNPFSKLLPNLSPKKKTDIRFTSLNNVHNNDIVNFARTVGKHIEAPIMGDVSRTDRLYVLEFQGDIMASRTRGLEREITTILNTARPGQDEVLIRLESPGGAAFAYGHAASQLDRLRTAGIKVTAAVDRVAASGGYMMAAVADNIISAPLAVIGSVGVVAEFLNFSQVLKSLGVDYKQYTAGEFKRTVSQFGEITPEGEEKFTTDLNRMHVLFKEHVSRYRPELDIEKFATGEHWSAVDALTHGLVDKIQTSEDYILNKITSGSVAIQVTYTPPRPNLIQVLSGEVSLVDHVIDRVVAKAHYYNLMLGK